MEQKKTAEAKKKKTKYAMTHDTLPALSPSTALPLDTALFRTRAAETLLSKGIPLGKLDGTDNKLRWLLEDGHAKRADGPDMAQHAPAMRVGICNDLRAPVGGFAASWRSWITRFTRKCWFSR